MASDTRRLKVVVTGDSASATRTFRAVHKGANDMNNGTLRLTKRLGSLAMSFRGVTAAAVAFVAGSAIVGQLKDSVDKASDLNETMNKMQVIFGKNSRQILAWSATSATSLGLSRQKAIEAASSFGNMFQQLGFGGTQATKMSTSVVKLATDLGSFNNLKTEEVLEMIAAGFRGEYDSLQRLIPNINAARVEKEAMAATGKKVAKELTAQEKAAATLAIIMKDGKAAENDFAETSDGLANKKKILAARIEDLKARLGEGLIPAISKMVGWFEAAIPPLEAFWNGLISGKNVSEGFLKKFQDAGIIIHNAVVKIAQTVRDELIPALLDIAGKIGAVVSWFRQHEAITKILIGAILGYVAALKLANVVLAVQAAIQSIVAGGGFLAWIGRITGATRIWAAAQSLLNAAFWANPITLIVLAIIGLVAVVVLAYRKFEGFRNVVDGVFRAVGAAASWLWNNVLKPTFSAIGTAAVWLWENAIKPAWNGIKAAFQNAVNAISWYWNNILKPVWSVIAAVAKWLWENVLKPAFNGIRAAWGALVTGIAWFWNNILKPVWNVIMFAAKVMGAILKVVFAVISWAWSQLVGAIKVWWEFVLKPVWNAVVAVARWLWNNVLKPVFGAIGKGWSLVVGSIKWWWENVLRPAWNGIKTFVDKVFMPMWRGIEKGVKAIFGAIGKAADTFKNTVSGIFGTLVNMVRNHLQRLIDVLNIAINAINKILPGKDIPPIPPIGAAAPSGVKLGTTRSAQLARRGLAGGGFVEGPGSDTSDSIPAMLSDGEYVVRARSVRKLGTRALNYLNKYGELPAFAAGGFVQNPRGYRPGMGRAVPGGVSSIIALYRKMGGTRGATSTYRPGDPLWHGSGLAVDFGGYNQDAVASRLMSVRGGLLELIHSTRSRNYGVSRGNVHNMGAQLWAEHKNHLHLAATPEDVAAILGGRVPIAGGGGFSIIGILLEKALNAALRGYNKLIPQGTDVMSSVVRNLMSGVGDRFKASILSKFGGAGGDGGPGQLGAWIAEAMRYVKIEWVEGLRTLIMRESGGNPRAINNWDSNAKNGDPSRGLMQTIGATFAAHRDPRLPNDIYHPVANIVAGMRYIHSKYGSLYNVQQAHADKPPKGYWQGIRSAPRGLAWVGEREPELLNFRGGESVTPLSKLSGGGGDVHLHFHGTIVADNPREFVAKLMPIIREETKKLAKRNNGYLPSG